MTMATILPADEEHALRRWMFAAATVAAVHGGLAFWLMYIRDSSSAGAPPAAIMIELPPMDVSSPSEAPPEAIEGPQMTETDPEKAETPPIEAIPEPPPALKPAVVPMTPPKVKPKPKKIVKEMKRPVVNRKHEPPQPRTQAPRHSEAPPGPTPAPRQGSAGSAASTASWYAQISAHLLRFKPAGAEGSGTASVSFTLTRGGRLLASGLGASSGSSALDQKALEMVRRANPYPAAPSEFSGGSKAFYVPVRFKK